MRPPAVHAAAAAARCVPGVQAQSEPAAATAFRRCQAAPAATRSRPSAASRHRAIPDRAWQCRKTSPPNLKTPSDWRATTHAAFAKPAHRPRRLYWNGWMERATSGRPEKLASSKDMICTEINTVCIHSIISIPISQIRNAVNPLAGVYPAACSRGFKQEIRRRLYLALHYKRHPVSACARTIRTSNARNPESNPELISLHIAPPFFTDLR